MIYTPTDIVYCPPNVDCPCYARLTAEVEQNAVDLEEYRRDVERLTAALRGAYEVFAGSDGFIPETAAEGYQQQIIKQMVDIISAALKEPRTDSEAATRALDEYLREGGVALENLKAELKEPRT